MSVRIGAVIPVLNEWRFLPAVVGQLLLVVDRVVLLRGLRSLSGAPVELSPVPRLDSRVEVVEGIWPDEGSTRNFGIEMLEDCDYVIGIDTDEIFTERDLCALAEVCDRERPEIVAVPLHTYWKSSAYRIDPPEPGTIKLALRRDRRYDTQRGVAGQVRTLDIWCHHLSYVRSDEELQEKLLSWGHADEIDPKWFESVWKAWDANPDLENLHPVHPSAYKRAIKSPDQELAAILESWGCR